MRFMIIHILSDDELEAIKDGDVVAVMLSGQYIGIAGRNFLSDSEIEEAGDGTSRTETSEEN